MWHSDIISLAPSRCWIHTHAAVCTYTQKPYLLSFSRCSPACICVTDTLHMYVCVSVNVLWIQNCFPAVQWQVQHEDFSSLTGTRYCASKKKKKKQLPNILKEYFINSVFYIFRGFHNNNIKAIPERAFVGNPHLQTMWVQHLLLTELYTLVK